jgi:hypothetical protein
MKTFFSKPWRLFFSLVGLLLLLFFLLPINLFDGEMVLQNGLSKQVLQVPLSLSYFIGLGYDEADMLDVQDFYLSIRGHLTAILFILFVPALIAYRVHLEQKKNKP